MEHDKSLYNALIEYNKLKMSSFHTPGHKNNVKILKSVFLLDLTELPQTDDLYNPYGSILNAEKKAAELFNVKKSLMSTSGSTLCIQTMLAACGLKGKKIIASRLIHKSAVNTMALLDIEPVWVYPEWDKNTGHYKTVSKNKILQIIKKQPDISAVYLTSPDYYGLLTDVKGITYECKKYKIPVLVDSAHGAHLQFLDKDLSAINEGADMVCISGHKTLPVITPGAWLNINNQKFVGIAKQMMSVFGSTSPSFQVMASLDLCVDWLKRHGKKAFYNLECKVKKINSLAKNKGLLIQKENSDPVRICFNVSNIGLDGKTAYEHFFKNKIEAEFFDKENIVFIPTPFNTHEDFLRLENAINTIPDLNKKDDKIINCKLDEHKVKRLSIREAVFSKIKEVDIFKAVGKISAQTACKCPPGIPVIIPGEEISKLDVEILYRCGISSIKVVK